jgi:hypothetical protein
MSSGPWCFEVVRRPRGSGLPSGQDERERREQAARSGHPINFCSYESLSELQKLAGTPQIREGSSPVRRLATIALENEAELAVTKQRLHKALAAGNPAPTSRKVLSRARRTTQGGLLDAQPSQGCAEAGGRREQAKGTAKLSRGCPDMGRPRRARKRVIIGEPATQCLRPNSRSLRS